MKRLEGRCGGSFSLTKRTIRFAVSYDFRRRNLSGPDRVLAAAVRSAHEGQLAMPPQELVLVVFGELLLLVGGAGDQRRVEKIGGAVRLVREGRIDDGVAAAAVLGEVVEPKLGLVVIDRQEVVPMVGSGGRLIVEDLVLDVEVDQRRRLVTSCLLGVGSIALGLPVEVVDQVHLRPHAVELLVEVELGLGVGTDERSQLLCPGESPQEALPGQADLPMTKVPGYRIVADQRILRVLLFTLLFTLGELAHQDPLAVVLAEVPCLAVLPPCLASRSPVAIVKVLLFGTSHKQPPLRPLAHFL